MKKLFDFLFSTRLMAIIIVVFAISIARATFIENSYDTSTARALVYNAWWFELLLLIGIINMGGTILVNKLYRKEKIMVLIIHVAFIVILIGAALTRYIGIEGSMHIREGETAKNMVTGRVYFTASAMQHNHIDQKQMPVYLSQKGSNFHKLTLKPGDKKITAELLQMTPNVVDTIIKDDSGIPLIELVAAGEGRMQNYILSGKQSKNIEGILFGFSDTLKQPDVHIILSDSGLMFMSKTEATVMNMYTQLQESLSAATYHPFLQRSLYNFGGLQVVLKDFARSGRLSFTPSKLKETGEIVDALNIRVSSSGESKTILYLAGRNALNNPVTIKIKDMDVSVSFGPKIITLPVALKLNKFVLEHYPGSNSPSWFESRIQLLDPSGNINEERRIYMNNVLRYGGFRFYQSSYDTDEKGTILSVNKDYWGSMVTYGGYILLVIGAFGGVFNKKSRFRKLWAEVWQLQSVRKNTTIFLMTAMVSGLVSIAATAQSTLPDSIAISKKQAAKFGELLIQDPGGRIKPLNTLSSEFLRKVSRSTSIMGQGSDQVFLGMLMYPAYWQKMPMIKVTNPDVKKLFHISDNYISFMDVLDSTPSHNYLLAPYVKQAYQKKVASRTQFDNEILRLDERINLCYMIYTGEMLRVFPKVNDPKNLWYTPLNANGHYTGNDSLFVTNIIPLYFNTLKAANVSKNIGPANEALSVLHNYQNKFGGSILPSSFKIKVEILYNNLEVFKNVGYVYGIIGFILLLLQFITIFQPRVNLNVPMKIGVIVIILCYVTHFAGLVTRWYIADHAPWSNAYESLVLIAFATITAGLFFIKKSEIPLSATAILASNILTVAHMNWMDPEISNLVPVLQSYWLDIHVFVIIIGYGFLALGAILALINLFIMIFQNQQNVKSSGIILLILTAIAEMTLIIGLYMLSIGTFLGGVWANESWGRYWGWDSKETWALVSVMVYAFIAHMRLIPGLKSVFAFNLMGLLGFSSIIMTYFGVNYFLSGLHSYAHGEAFPIPVYVYYTLAVIALIAILAWVNQYTLKKSGVTYPKKINE